MKPHIDEARATLLRDPYRVCAECTSVLGAKTMFHVDHVVPMRELIARFEASAPYVPYVVLHDPESMCRHRFAPADAEFEKSWVAFHREHAVLRLLCARCNLVRG